MWNTAGNAMGSIGGSLLDSYFMDQQNDFLMNLYKDMPSNSQNSNVINFSPWMMDNSQVNSGFIDGGTATDGVDISDQLPNLPY